ncbi:MAG TPA: hypothetical protein VGZ52_06515 [Acidimicrobiales bacterium]|nr:hypothetical protein [Acidimicrobiales bacterium]
MRWRRSTPALAAVLLVACSSGAKSSSSGADSPVVQASGATTTSIVVGPDGSSSVVAAPDGGNASSSSCPAGTGCAGGGAGPAVAIAPNGPPGSYAPVLLAPARSGEVDVDLRAQSSAGIPQSSVDHLTSVLGSVTGKPVHLRPGPPIGGAAKSWSADELRSIADDASAVQPSDGVAVIHLLIVHGSFEGNDSVLGVSVQGDAAAVFIDQVDASSTPLVDSNGIATAVVTHEVGHLLGLVDLYLHTGRQDPAHPGHSTDQHSVMYWAVESNLVADLLQGGPPTDFDAADLADLKTIHDGG